MYTVAHLVFTGNITLWQNTWPIRNYERHRPTILPQINIKRS